MLAVVAQRRIPAPVERVWGYLSQEELIARWFADATRFRPGQTFRLDLGDGDFYNGRISLWSPPSVLEFRWRFMGIGPEYEVCLSLLPRKGGTELSIQDKGAVTLDEALCLRVGWGEFLFRIEKAIREGRSARFDWRREITLTAILDGRGPQVRAALADPDWYRQALADTRARAIDASPEGMTAVVANDAWGGTTTRLDIQFRRSGQTDYLFLAHRGWAELPAACAAGERRRFAGLWVDALSGLGAV
jgi:uncharacterized protein YndB with AHSA1/START domain